MDFLVIFTSVLTFLVGAALFAMGWAGTVTWWQVGVGFLLMLGAVAADWFYVKAARKG